MANALGGDISAEFDGAELGDPRRTRRLVKLAEHISQAPGLSFPRLASSPSELEAMYRFFANEHIDWNAVLAPHVAATVERCESQQTVLVVHDTTEFSFPTENDAREGMGYLPRGQRGFEAHFALAVSEADGVPLGVLGVMPYARGKSARKPGEPPLPKRRRPRSEMESDRWRELAAHTEQLIAGTTKKVHVMDSEADSYALFGELMSEHVSFVIRAHHDRYLEGDIRLLERMDAIESKLFREVPISARKGTNRKTKVRVNVRRNARDATLHVRAARLELRRPTNARLAPEGLELNAVQVYEPNPPEGQVPVEWTLLTTEPIDSQEAIERIVDIYRARWRIEEYFKALKTGCAYETRQLMSLHGLLNALAVLIPIAWRLLALRHLAHRGADTPATVVLSTEELQILKAISKRVRLGTNPSVQDVLWAIAGLGGHLKNNGPPGWQTIWAGFGTFAIATEVWRLAKTSDQS